MPTPMRSLAFRTRASKAGSRRRLQGVMSAGIVPVKTLDAIMIPRTSSRHYRRAVVASSCQKLQQNIRNRHNPFVFFDMSNRTGHDDARDRLLKALGRPFAGDELFDAVPDTVFFLKDAEGRYVAVNQTLVVRAGRKSKSELIGLCAYDVFPGALGDRIAAQDRAVTRTRRPIHRH